MGPPGRRVLQRATAMGIVANYHLYLQQLWWVSCDGPSFLTDWLAGCLAVILSKSRDTQSLTTMMMSQGIFESCCNWRSSIPVCPLRFYEPPLVLQIAHLIPFNCTRNGHCRTMYQPVTTTIEESGNCWVSWTRDCSPQVTTVSVTIIIIIIEIIASAIWNVQL